MLCFIAVYSSTNILTKAFIEGQWILHPLGWSFQHLAFPLSQSIIFSDLHINEKRICVQIENEKRNWQRVEGLECTCTNPQWVEGRPSKLTSLRSVCLEGRCTEKPSWQDTSDPSVRSRCFHPQKPPPDLVCSRAPKTWDMSIVGIQGKKRWFLRRKFRWITWQMTKKARNLIVFFFLWWKSGFMPNEGCKLQK